MELSNEILSDITVHMKYARYLDKKNRRETLQTGQKTDSVPRDETARGLHPNPVFATTRDLGSAVIRSFTRVAGRDAPLAGVTVPVGQRVVACYGGANRKPFPKPET